MNNSNEEYQFQLVPEFELYYNEDSSFGVYKFTTLNQLPNLAERKDIINKTQFYQGTLSGRMQKLYVGDTYNVTAKLVYNNKYKNWQYEPIAIKAAIPKTIEQQAAFLQSILTKKQTEALLNNYPNIVEDIMNGEDEVDVSLLKGIGEITYKRIKEKIINNYVISDILTMLQPLGITLRAIKNLEKWERNPVLLKRKLLANPYILTEIRGLGFKRVDAFALKIKPDLKCSYHRLKAYIMYYLQDLGETYGHTWISINILKNNIKDNVIECYDLFDDFLEKDMISEVPLLRIDDGGKIGLRRYYEVEKYIYDKLTSMQQIEPKKVSSDEIFEGICIAEEEQGFELTEEQSQTVVESFKSNFTIISGKAGVGKSCTVRSILTIYDHANYKIACCALSAKAAKVIEESTGFPAKTIHRMLGAKGTNKFTYNENNQLLIDVLFIDEGSMINADIFYHILQAIPTTTKVIICGDNGQLPPIGYGNIFNDLLDMREYFNCYELTKIMRQATDSGIITDANQIRDGLNPIDKPEPKIVTGKLQDMTYMFRDDRETLNNIAIRAYMGAIKTYGTDDTLIGVPRKKDCVNSTARFNEIIQDLLLPDETTIIKCGTRQYKLGAKIIQRVNNYEKNIFNGDIGYITQINEDGFTVEFKSDNDSKEVEYENNEIDQIDLAYAMTIHSLQGSGYKAVIVVIDNTHYALLDNCLLYTAITRAKIKCLLLAEPSAFQRCIKTNKTMARQTWLSEFIPF